MSDGFLGEFASRTESALDRFLPRGGPTANLGEAMRYACLGGGKRLRATLVYATGGMLGAPYELLDYPAAAIEMVHAYSLVHDDLPAMDDDDLRRGKPTCHRAFGEATAILAGDALQSLAFELLSSPDSGIGSERRNEMVSELARASGAAGMAGGQALDLAAVGATLDLDQLGAMHRLKTGALIRAAVRLGALCGGEVDTTIRTGLDHYAESNGLAFQIVDDILDETMDSATLGKTGGADRARDKPTYTSMLGLEHARQAVATLRHEALESLATIGHNTEVMRKIADFVTDRTH